MKTKMKLLPLMMVALTVVVAGIGGWLWSANLAPPASSAQRFRITTGENLTVVSERLEAGNLVGNSFLFRIFYRILQEDGAIQSGTFGFPGGLSTWDAAVFFHKSRPLVARITVPEGWTSSKIARLLEEKQVVSAKAFMTVVTHPGILGPAGQGLVSLEGRLFPDTYQFPIDSPAEEIARTFLQTFQNRINPWISQYTSEELNRRIILASIVEREYRDPAEAPLIASVFSNRLDKGIPLGSCATIEYILTEVLGRPHPNRILFSYTEIPSAYNTYLNKGLPPGAIANPGLTALKAAFSPSASDYLFFVVSDSSKGTHTFSSNFEQHQKAREAYLTTFVSKG